MLRGVCGVSLPIGSFRPDTLLTIKASLLYIYAAKLRRLFSIRLQTGIIAGLEYVMDQEAIVKYTKRGTKVSSGWIPVVPRYFL